MSEFKECEICGSQEKEYVEVDGWHFCTSCAEGEKQRVFHVDAKRLQELLDRAVSEISRGFYCGSQTVLGVVAGCQINLQVIRENSYDALDTESKEIVTSN